MQNLGKPSQEMQNSMEDPVIPFDLVRMFIGTEPPMFFLEILFRTCLIYFYALVLIRWVGGRGIAQMSTVEFLLVIALGSAVGDAMFYADVPLLQAMLVITAVVVINKGLDVLIYRYETVEKVVDGRTAEAIRDGVIITETLRHAKIGTSELFESLRQAGFENLGQVRRAYLETSGRFSFFRANIPRSGLAVEPAWNVAPPSIYGPYDVFPAGTPMVCCNCGTVTPDFDTRIEKCDYCGGTVWTTATHHEE